MHKPLRWKEKLLAGGYSRISSQTFVNPPQPRVWTSEVPAGVHHLIDVYDVPVFGAHSHSEQSEAE